MPDLATELARRPWWLNVAFALCLFGTFVFMPYDLFLVPFAKAEEVWGGVTLHGWAAKAGEVAHWVVYALGAWGLWRMRPWLPVGAALYMLQVAVAHLVWSQLSPRGHGILVGLVQASVFAAIAVVFWRSRRYFRDAS